MMRPIKKADSIPYDEKSAQVSMEIQQFLRDSKDTVVSCDKLVPPHASDKAAAALTFASILTLATAGDLDVSQACPYGAILIKAR
mmetsp:Transcript_4210/g.9175  ORF Transcript_4210/g.9175 Transcript_4210/m.9175 type:complete len:85 (+) Transcript_4210:594-848(+)